MQKQTFIPGKEASLEVSIQSFQQKLQSLGFNIEVVSSLNPVPYVWSIHIRDTKCPLCFTNGKGACDKASLASALGEYFERLSTNYFFSDFYLGEEIANSPFVHYPNEKWFAIENQNTMPKGLLTPELWQFYNPLQELRPENLIDLQSSNHKRGICALPFTEINTKQVVYFPVNIIGNLYVSNGMAAGNTANEARVQALSEIFERYVKNKIISEAISLPEIPLHVLARYPYITEAIDTLGQEGFPIYCYDASLGGQYPVICVALFNPQNGSCFASFGAHPNFGVALERTVTELLQGRSLTELDVFSPPSFDNDDVAEQTNLETHFIDSSGLISWDLFKQQADYTYCDWNFANTAEKELSTLLAIYHQLGMAVYIADYTHLNVYTCRILVPGMSEIYPPEDLLLANNNMAAHLRKTILTLPDSSLTASEYLTIIELLDDLGIDDFTRIRELLGIATGQDNAWYTLRVGELKAMLALAGQDLQQAESWIEWTLEFNRSIFPKRRLMDYHCLHTLTKLLITKGQSQFFEYYTALCKMYSQQHIDELWSIVCGQQRFYGLFSVDANLTQFNAHQNLLNTYKKLQESKL